MGVTLQFIPYNEIERLSSEKRIQKILNSVKDNKIVLLQGQLKKEEEAKLIQTTMEDINDTFKGIEHAVILPNTKKDDWHTKIKRTVQQLVMGNQIGFTIVGPANIVKEIKKNPDKIELLTKDVKKKKRK